MVIYNANFGGRIETAAAEMRAAYKVGSKDGATMMQEIQD